jgi:DTW domain-containing protein YfiP
MAPTAKAWARKACNNRRARLSRYGKLRKEPHRAGLSTIEAAAMLLAKLEGNPKIEAALNVSFAKMLERYRGGGGWGK